MAFGDTIQSPTNTGSSGGASVTFSAATAGNLLIFVVGRSASATWDSISGWTALPNGAGNMSCAAWYKIAAGGETSVSSTATGGNWCATVVEIEGPFTATPLDQTAEDETHLASTTTSQASGTTGTTAQNDEIAIAYFAVDSGSSVVNRSYNNSFIEVVYSSSGARAPAAVAKRILSATGTYSTTFTWTTGGTADEAYGGIATFKKGTSDININLAAAALTASGQALSVAPGAISTSLNVAALASSGPQLSVQTITTLDLSAASLLASGQAIGITPGAVSTVLLAAALAAQGQTIQVSAGGEPVQIDLSAAVMSILGQTLGVSPGVMSVLLSAAGLAAGGQVITPQPGAVSIDLLVAALSAAGQIITISAPEGLSVNLSAASLTAGGQSITITPGAASVALLAAVLAAAGQTLTVEAITNILLNAAQLNATGQMITISAPEGVSVNLSAASLMAGGQSITVTPGTVNVILQVAALAAQGQVLIINQSGETEDYETGMMLGLFKSIQKAMVKL